MSFHHVQTPDRAPEEIHRVLKAGGRLVVEEFDPSRGQGRRTHAFERTFGGDRSIFYPPTSFDRGSKSTVSMGSPTRW